MTQDQDDLRIVKAAGQVIANAALDLIEADYHRFSERPCATCDTVSRLLGRKWGCAQINGFKFSK